MMALQKEFLEIINTSIPFEFKYNNKPVIIYGAGMMGEQSSIYLKKAGIEIECFLDKNQNNIGKQINSISIIHPETLTENQKKNCLFAVGLIKFPFNDMKDYLLSLGCEDVCYVGHLVDAIYKEPSIANIWGFKDISDEEKSKLVFSFEYYKDEQSKKNLMQLLNWIVFGVEKIYTEQVDNADNKYFPKEIMDILKNDEIFIDCGAYNGNSIERIEKATEGRFNSIISFEPDKQNFILLNEYISNRKNKVKISAHNYGLGLTDGKRNFTSGLGLTSRYTDIVKGEAVQMHRLDTLDLQYTFLRVYGLGIGWEVISGGLESIKRNRPIVAVNIHHTKADFVNFPYILMSNLKEYNIFLRLHGYCGSEAVIYAIPNEREKDE